MSTFLIGCCIGCLSGVVGYILWTIYSFPSKGHPEPRNPRNFVDLPTEAKLNDEDIMYKPNISEPVYSFVQCVKDNPERFKLEDDKPYGLNISSGYTLHDKVLDKVYSFFILKDKVHVHRVYFLTWDEKCYLYKQLGNLDKIREVNLERKALNAKRRERNEYKALYCTQEEK